MFLVREVDDDLVACLPVDHLDEVAVDLEVLDDEVLVGEVLVGDDKSLALGLYSYML